MNTAFLLNFAPWAVAALSLIGIIVIVLRKIQVLLKLPATPQEGQVHVSAFLAAYQRLALKIKGLRYSSYQPALAAWFEKFLRKMRVVILKLDNVFLSLIGHSREKTQIWTVRSRAWMEQHKLKKFQKLQVLEKLDQAEIIETIQKAKEEVKEEKENGKKKENGKVKEVESASEIVVDPKAEIEKECIDMISRDPRCVDAYKKLGFLYLEQGNKDDAKNCFRQVLKLQPDDLEVVSKMRELLD